MKNKFGYDDSLDVFGVHGIGGIVGAIGTGFLCAPSLGGTGFVYDAETGTMMRVRSSCRSRACVTTIVWSRRRLARPALHRQGDHRPPGLDDDERQGLDLTSHGESAYHA